MRSQAKNFEPGVALGAIAILCVFLMLSFYSGVKQISIPSGAGSSGGGGDNVTVYENNTYYNVTMNTTYNVTNNITIIEQANLTGYVNDSQLSGNLSNYFNKEDYYANLTDLGYVDAPYVSGEIALATGDFITKADYWSNATGYFQPLGTYMTWAQAMNGTLLTSVPGTFATGAQLSGNLTSSYVSATQLSGNLSASAVSPSQLSGNLTGYQARPTFKGSSVQIANNASYATVFAISLTASKINIVESLVIANTSATGNGVRLRATVNDNANTGSCTFASPSGATAQTFDTISLTTTAGNTGETASALANLPMVFEINCAVLATTGTNTLTINVTNELTTGTTNIYPESYYVVRAIP